MFQNNSIHGRTTWHRRQYTYKVRVIDDVSRRGLNVYLIVG